MPYKIGKFKYHSCYQGDEGLVLQYPEDAGQTFKAGELVKFASGKIAVVTESAGDTILGFALKDASGVTDAMVPVQVIRPGDVFVMDMETDDTFVVADTGVDYALKRTNNKFMVNQDDRGTAADNAVWVLGSLEYDATGVLRATAGGPVYVRFNPSNIEFSKDV